MQSRIMQSRNGPESFLPRLALFLLLLPLSIDARAPSEPVTASAPLAPAWTFQDQAGSDAGYWTSGAGDVNGDGFDDVIVGALFHDGEGRAFLFLGSPSGLSLSPAWSFACNQAGARCGETVSGAGDVNGDGYDDILVGAPYYDNGELDEGRAYLFQGSTLGPSATPDWMQEGNQAGAAFGFVSSAGDVNGDGYDDVLVTAHFFDNTETDEGRAFLYLGSSAGLGTVPSWSQETNQNNAVLIAFGAGDVNADGFDDILLGSRQYDSGEPNEGKAFLHLGSPSGPSVAPVWTAEANQSAASFGFITGSAGDVNSDGYGDVLILADSFSNPESAEGAAFVWLGGPSGKILQGIDGTPQNADWKVEGEQAFTFLRWGGSVGDFDLDGFGDVVVGAALYNAGQSQEGRVLIFRGSASGLEDTPAWFAEGGVSFARLGWTAGGAGDVNGDGAGDVLAGAPGIDGAVAYHGRPTECFDQDLDGYGSPGSSSCPGGVSTDCDDSNTSVHPGAAELCNGVDDDCDALVDEGVAIQAIGSSNPSTLNVSSQGTSFTVHLTLENVCDPDAVVPIPGELLERTYVSRAGSIMLLDPLSIACPGPDGSFLFERGIADDPASRTISQNRVTLRFDQASDGDCSTLDGDRQEIVALLSDVPDGSVVPLCIAGTADGADFETCMLVTVNNRGNR